MFRIYVLLLSFPFLSYGCNNIHVNELKSIEPTKSILEQSSSPSPITIPTYLPTPEPTPKNQFTFTSKNMNITGFDVNNQGEFILTGDSFGKESDIYLIKYSKENNTVEEHKVNNYLTGRQSNSLLAMSQDNYFVISWLSYSQNDEFVEVYAQIFDFKGKPIKDKEFKVNKTNLYGFIPPDGIHIGGYDDFSPKIKMLYNGNFVLSWFGNTGEVSTLFSRVFDINGNPLTDEIKISSNKDKYFSFYQGLGTSRKNNFCITWPENESRVFKTFDDSLKQINNDFKININDIKSMSLNNDNTFNAMIFKDEKMAIKRLDKDGNDKEIEFFINEKTTFSQLMYQVRDNYGNLVIIWKDKNNNSYLSKLDANGDIVKSEIKIENLISGGYLKIDENYLYVLNSEKNEGESTKHTISYFEI
jgi:hypothetical protein